MKLALKGATVFTGDEFIQGYAVIVQGRFVSAIVPDSSIPEEVAIQTLKGGILAPGFIDVQVNGGGGALLNRNPSIDVVQTIAVSHRRFGTTGMLPTVITDSPRVISSAMAAVREAQQAGDANVLGIHIEGPFLDPMRKGAHDPDFIRGLSDDDVKELTEAACGSLMLTIAPNKVPAHMIRKLCAAGILVSLGHSEARYDEVVAALDAGASSFTHLFNAMSQLTGREPGMVGAALTDPRAHVGVIADGHHVHDAALRLAFAAAPRERFMLVSDAMPPAAGGPDEFELQGRRVSRVGGRLQLDDGTLAGSNLTMDEAVRYCVYRLGLSVDHALQMASRNPARFLRRADLGVLRPGALASMVHMDDKLHVLQTWVEGK